MPISVSEDVPSPWEDNSLLEEEIIKKKGGKFWIMPLTHAKNIGSYKGFECAMRRLYPLRTSSRASKVLFQRSASARKIMESEELSEIKQEYQFLVSHCCRKTYEERKELYLSV